MKKYTITFNRRTWETTSCLEAWSFVGFLDDDSVKMKSEPYEGLALKLHSVKQF